MSFTINGTTLEQTASPAILSDLVGLTNVFATANNTIVDTSAYTDVKITGDFILEGTLIVTKLTIANASCNVYVGTNSAGDVLKPGYIAVVNGSTTAIQPNSLNFDFVLKNSTLDFVGGGRGGYYNGGYLYNMDGCVIVGNGLGSIGINAGSTLKNTTYINMNDVSFFGNPSDTTGFVISGSTVLGAFIDQFNNFVELKKFTSPRYVVQRSGKFALTDCKVTEWIACRFRPTINNTFYLFLRTIKTTGLGENANASTIRYVYDAGGSLLSQAALNANGTLTEAIQWGKVYAYDLGQNQNMNTLNNKMTPAMINNNNGTYQHMSGEYKLPLSVSHVSYLGLLVVLPNINFDVSSDEILTDFTLEPNLINDPNLTEVNEYTFRSTVGGYTTLSTAAKLYDRAKLEFVDVYDFQNQTTVNKSGNLIDCRDLNVVIDATASQAFNLSGNTLTIKSSDFIDDMLTTGIITLVNGAVFSGTRTDQNGTVLPLRTGGISGITSDSRLKILNKATGITTFNEIVNSTTYTEQYQEGSNYSQGNQIEITLTHQSGTTAKIPLISLAIVGKTGWSLFVSQKDLTAYSSLGADGSTVTEYNIDSNTGNLEIDANDIDCYSSKRHLVARYYYLITTEEGINSFVNAIILEDEANAIIDRTITNLLIDNTGNCTLNLTDSDFRLYTSDGSSWIKDPPTGGFGIISDSGKVYIKAQADLENKVNNLIDREDADIYISPTSYVKKKKGTDVIIVTKNFTTDGQGNETLTETT